MAQYNKGLETKNKIIRSARELFYEKGYCSTSTREISEKAGTNLGLLKYYFKGKNEIGMIIYCDIRNAFDELTAANEPALTGPDLFLFSSALELYLCLENEAFGRLYYELSFEPAFHQAIEAVIINALMKYAQQSNDSQYALLSCLSIMAIKPALVNHSLNARGEISTDTYVHYYLGQQLHVLGLPPSHADTIIQILKRYYVNVAAKFTPIMTRLLT